MFYFVLFFNSVTLCFNRQVSIIGISMNYCHWVQNWKKSSYSLCQCFATASTKKNTKHKKNREADELQLSWGDFYDTVNFTEMHWNVFFLKFIRLIFKSSIRPILWTSLMVSLGIQPNCLLLLSEMKTPIAFSFPPDKSIVTSCKCSLMPFRKDSSSCNLETPSLNFESPVRDTLISTKERRIKLTW